MVGQDPYASERHLKRIKVIMPITLAGMAVLFTIGLLVPAARDAMGDLMAAAGAFGGIVIGWHAIRR
jgi:hypothetical protein